MIAGALAHYHQAAGPNLISYEENQAMTAGSTVCTVHSINLHMALQIAGLLKRLLFVNKYVLFS